jgi:hypothetical protein
MTFAKQILTRSTKPFSLAAIDYHYASYSHACRLLIVVMADSTIHND